MSEPITPIEPAAAAPASPTGAIALAAPATPGGAFAALWPGRWVVVGAVVLAALGGAALVLVWNTQQRVKTIEAELVKRQQDSSADATEARTLARQAEQAAREAGAKIALLEARVAETSLQRSQIEELMQSLARSRDENVLADVDAAIRVAMQQAAITGSAEPLVLTLKQADERLARFSEPRLELVRRAVSKDLDRVRAAGVTDPSVLSIRLDEIVRQLDDLPLVSAPQRRTARSVATSGSAATIQGEPAASGDAASAAAAAAVEPAASSSGWRSLGGAVGRWWNVFAGSAWQEVRDLIRITRIDKPEAMLVAPEQAFFLRENLKLRLLNARLALMSRQFDAAQPDLRDAQQALDRYFDRSDRRVAAASQQVREVASQARLVGVPRPDATLAAIATASSGR